MRVTVSGLPGSGTTSLARQLAAAHHLTLISAGEVFRQMAREKGMELAEFGRLAEHDPSIDREIDTRQKEIAGASEDIVAEGRLSGWFVNNADLKVCLFAPLERRVERILARDSVEGLGKALEVTREREICEARRYKEYYGIDINDLAPYHLVLNSDLFGVKELGAIVNAAIQVVRDRSRKGNAGNL